MAVSPSQILSEMNEKDNLILEKLENELDDLLREKYQGTTLRIDSSFFKDATERVRKKLLKKYELIGWLVESNSDRDGYYYEFSESQ